MVVMNNYSSTVHRVHYVKTLLQDVHVISSDVRALWRRHCERVRCVVSLKKQANNNSF